VGFVLGVYAAEFIQQATIPLIVVGVLAVLAIGGWIILRRKRAPTAPDDTYECWADCSCPACVVLTGRTAAGAS
jgi:LPXTG-motif cell wall-anchored protein